LDGSGVGVSVLCPGPVRTRIFEGHANRERVAARIMGSAALEPAQVGARVLHAITHDEFYVFTHGTERATIQARHARIEAALDEADAFWQRN